MKHSIAARNAKADALARLVDDGYLRIYSGPAPTNADTAPGGGNTLLAELRFATTCAPAADDGVLTFNAIAADSSANASGTATWFRVLRSDGTSVVFDGSVSEGGADGTINKASIVAGSPVNINAFTYTVPEG